MSDYGSRVLQGVESDVKGALSNIDGLTGSLLSTVLAEVNSVLAVALQTAAPIPNRVDAVLPVSQSCSHSNSNDFRLVHFRSFIDRSLSFFHIVYFSAIYTRTSANITRACLVFAIASAQQCRC